jgi:hypothetical protein
MMENKLANGMTVTYLDESKGLAADRWLVKLRCRIAMPLQDWMLSDMARDDPQALFCREQFAGHLVHEIVQERNFIDVTDKERVLTEIREHLDDSVRSYLSKGVFVRQLFKVKLAEFIQLYTQQGWTGRLEEGVEIEDPTDFSACFR